MLAMSRPDVAPGATETQQLRVMVPTPGVRISTYSPSFHENDAYHCWVKQSLVRLRLRIAFTSGGVAHQDQTDYSFPTTLMA